MKIRYRLWDTEEFARKYIFIYTIICQNIKITVWVAKIDVWLGKTLKKGFTKLNPISD